MAVAVCVTGAGGFIGSWIVKLLLARGYAVRGTSRLADDPKNAHLWALDGAAERLTMLQVDLLDRASLRAAFHGCDGVIHTASPMHDNPEEIIEPIIAGTRNVVEAAADAGVQRLVVSSTIGTMYMNPHRDPDAPLDESSWSDLDYCKKTEVNHDRIFHSPPKFQQSAWQAARARGLDLAVVIPVVVLGELLQPSMNTSTLHILKYLTGKVKEYVNESHAYVHVKDAAEAHVRVLEAPGAGGRRYVCAERTLHRGELCRILAGLFPEYPIPTRCKDDVNPPKKGYKFTNQPLKDLGIRFTPAHEYLYEAVTERRGSPPQGSPPPMLISKL
ncbi:Cinnamoyl-CoA reductase 1 [Dichanthelium oligosanthes]|uniref:Cinnamoyl-CoA reductase 1 n=1 Tax=Dichanthelium oligosanthes TaxID=888268 RepID=A0A1E5VMJ6_9POAL|nr:Cinnamoyl-CoA reductase 1 [Dichanthelium oligosanthes]